MPLAVGSFACAGICVATDFLDEELLSQTSFAVYVAILSLLTLAMLLALLVLARIPEKKCNLRFRVGAIFFSKLEDNNVCRAR